jgi:4-hydroxybenzoate polyprenyltransferase
MPDPTPLVEPPASPIEPLCVDLDSTLIATDLLQESLIRYLTGNPLRIFQVVFWLLKGRPWLKKQLAQRVVVEPDTIPWRNEVLEVLRRKKLSGRNLYLVTAANRNQAAALVHHLGLFEDVFGSDESHNLKGRNKAAFLREKFGARKFDYAGDARADFPVWADAQAGMVVGSVGRIKEAQAINPRLEPVILEKQKWILSVARLMRFHQWSKNLIIFVPVITAHLLTNLRIEFFSILAFASFCCMASAAYICNDLADIRHDRLHCSKKHRPLASGEISLLTGAVVTVLLIAASFVFALFLPLAFLSVLVLYFTSTLAYSLYLKSILLADALTLACLYTVRLLAGHAATKIPLSIWLLAFAMFIFFSLALAKRLAEIKNLLLSAKEPWIRGRGYHVDDLPALLTIGIASGVTSVLVLVLYITSPEVRELYDQPVVLLLLAPAFLYWIGRIWIMAQRGCLNEDPIIFALKDKASYVVVAFAFLVMAVAAY